MSDLWTVKDANEAVMRLKDPTLLYEANVKWDGCVDLYLNHSLDGETNEPIDQEYMHICDLDGLIERLQALKAIAVAQFPGGWPR